jgi:hypothetical protein
LNEEAENKKKEKQIKVGSVESKTTTTTERKGRVCCCGGVCIRGGKTK